MTDNSKRIESDGYTLFQVGFETLVPNDNKLYGLQRGTKGQMSAKLVEITDTTDLTDYAKIEDLPDAAELMTGTAAEVEDLASDADLATTVTKVNALLAALRDRGVLADDSLSG